MHTAVPLETVGLSEPSPLMKAFFHFVANSSTTISSPEMNDKKYKKEIPKEKMSKKHIFGESKKHKDGAFQRIDVGPAKQMREKILAASLFPSVYAK